MSLNNRKSMEPYLKDSVEYWPHQVEGVRKLCRWKSFILADDMGLGKSLQTITVFLMDVFRGWSSTAIIVCPATLKGNWADEFEKFTRVYTMTLTGTPTQRRVQLKAFKEKTGAKVLIVNYEQVTAHVDELNAIGFDVGIYDEAHYLKSPESKRTLSSFKLNTYRSMMLTGTPVLNNVNELWSLLHKIDPKRFSNYYRFVNRYCVYGGHEGKSIVGVKNKAELQAILDQVMLRRLKKDVLDLPEIQIIERRVDLLPLQRRLYDSVENEMKLPGVNSASDTEIENALVKFLRQKQICGTTATVSDVDESSKLDLIVSDDKEITSNGNYTVTFTQFREVLACYVERLQRERIPVFQLHGDVKIDTRNQVVKDWAACPEPAVLAAITSVAGVGLNMTRSRDCAFIDKLFVPGGNRQAIDRLHRIGQGSQPVRVREYIARNTIESRVQEILNTKTKIIGSVIDTDSKFKRELYAAAMAK